MKTPFTTAQFLDVFKAYNQAVWPFQVALYLLALFSVFLIIRRKAGSDKTVSVILSFFWLWMGLVYHLLFFTAINKAAYLFSILFVIQGLLFAFYGVYKNKIAFQFNKDVFGIMGLLLIGFSLIFYPLIGYSFGHRFPYNPTFGLPCPTTIFTLGLLLWTFEKVPLVLSVIPFVWSLIGFTAVINFGIYEDSGLLISGLIAATLLFVKKRRHRAIHINTYKTT